MSYRRRHRWFRRMALGLAFASVVFAGRVSVASAKFDESTDGSRYISAGGWSGLVDMESGIPLSAGIPHGDEQFVDAQEVMVIPYLSQGILTEADAQAAAAAEAIRDPYLTDVFVRPGESLGGPDGDEIAIRNALATQAAAAAEAIRDPYLTDVFVRPGESLGGPDGREAVEKSELAQSGIAGDEIAFANAVVAAAESLHDPITAAEQARQEPFVIPYLSHGILGEDVKSAQSTGEQFVPGVTDFPSVQSAPLNRVERALEQGPQVIPYFSHGMTADDVVGARPDDRTDRFAHSDVATRPELASSGGSTLEWNDALTVGIGALVLALGLGLALGYLRRPRLAGL